MARWDEWDPVREFWPKVRKDSATGCWNWEGTMMPNGYGQAHRRGTRIYAHRLAYQLSIGAIPDGLTIDHLCRNRRCVNPDHLEAVTLQENIRRATHSNREKTHCKSGHEFTPENTYVFPDGKKRHCRACGRRWAAERRARRQAPRPTQP